ncbi:uncharacterized protein LOC141696087 [Apium graveolens]|uniref:uncharacterized protein LOC141696087 n=1 Tax=Apium graveolens TaxID=4045 RepID=UPI003D7C00B1
MTTTSASYASTTIGSTSTSSSSIVDVNHPFYLHPFDSPGMQLTSVILSESHYNQWCRSMEIALSSKLKLGFVDGTCVKPVSTSPLFLHWIRCNNMVTSWLLNSISVEIRNSVVYMKSAMDIWIDLATRFAQSNVPKLFQLRSEISHLTQENLLIAGYFAKFRAVNDELECMVTKPRCTCAFCKCTVNANLDAYEQDVKLSQFLMGLSEQFTGIRGQILMMTPLPSLSQCYSLLLQEENQRSVALSSSVVP